jgi:hypothetical protein
MNEWYLLDTERNEVVNCCTTSGEKPDIAKLFPGHDAPRYVLTTNPPTVALHKYRYYWERP